MTTQLIYIKINIFTKMSLQSGYDKAKYIWLIISLTQYFKDKWLS